MPALARMLRTHREQRFALGQARPEDFVFGTFHGTPLHYRNVVRRGLDAAVDRAGLVAAPRLRFHDLRHTFASLLIAKGPTSSSCHESSATRR
jgi:integrase